jgi:hypothetical protein
MSKAANELLFVQLRVKKNMGICMEQEKSLLR